MSRTLNPPDQIPRTLNPTTTAKIAQRMLSTSSIVGEMLPSGFYSAVILEMLLSLFIFEDDARYLLVDQLINKPGVSATVMRRWLAVLVEQDYVEQRHSLVALTAKGFASVDQLVQTVYDVQRTLD